MSSTDKKKFNRLSPQLASYINSPVASLPTPSAILNRRILAANCARLLDATAALGVALRCHVKTHKTVEATQLQVGDTGDVRLVCSTVAEILWHERWLAQCRDEGRRVSVIYGIPPSSTCFARLEAMRKRLGVESVGFLLDHVDQLRNVAPTSPTPGGIKVPVWIKVDTGYHRAGVSPSSAQLDALVHGIATSHAVQLQGFYSHNSNSYSVSDRAEGLAYLASEIEGARDAADYTLDLLRGFKAAIPAKLSISVGASPSVTSIYHLSTTDDATVAFASLVSSVKQTYDLELHAGVYPVLDMQQLATQPPSTPSTPSYTTASVALRIHAEVLSVYADRARPEALLGAGVLALGREPCKAYPGFGVVAPAAWETARDTAGALDGWVVGRVSQEHGILTWNGGEEVRELEVGEKVGVIVNHACIAGAGFGEYFVVDGDGGKVVDVWRRCEGW